MKEYICRVAQKGFFAGPVCVVSSAASGIKKTSADPEEETAKLDSAVEIIKKTVDAGSKENAEVMETVGMMLDDETFIGEIKQYIKEEKCNAEYAVKTKCGEYAKKMENAPTDYLRARASDVTGIGEQLIGVMKKNESALLKETTALVAPEISPAQMSAFDGKLVGGIITDKGSPDSHLSIIAGNLEIPYIYGNSEAVSAAEDGSFIIIDGDKLIIDPDEKQKAEAEEKMICKASEKKSRRQAGNNAVCKTKIYANIGGTEDIPQLLGSGADGVGLFRSEFLFLGKNEAPSEEEQYAAYRFVLEAMKDREVIIRTMDLGSDKSVDWLEIPKETNPALGLRGARVSLERKDVFYIQLRALLRAGVFGNLKIMFPMISSEWEIDEIKKCVEEVAEKLEKEKVSYKIPKLGIMIETPAAVMIADILSKKVDFFSIGTNDLTQYTIATDREAQGLDRYFDRHHEAVLRMIEKVICEGHKNGIKVGICGGLAADPDVIGRLIKAGVDELSVPISKVGQTRANAAKAENKDESAADRSIYAPADGKLIPMNEIPDPVFSDGQLGKCIGILPENGHVFSPCDGKIIHVAETGHAVTICSDDGKEYLLHVGIDTVKLGGKGFKVLVSEGEHVNRSKKIIEADLGFIEKSGFSTVVVLAQLQ